MFERPFAQKKAVKMRKPPTRSLTVALPQTCGLSSQCARPYFIQPLTRAAGREQRAEEFQVGEERAEIPSGEAAKKPHTTPPAAPFKNPPSTLPSSTLNGIV